MGRRFKFGFKPARAITVDDGCSGDGGGDGGGGDGTKKVRCPEDANGIQCLYQESMSMMTGCRLPTTPAAFAFAAVAASVANTATVGSA